MAMTVIVTRDVPGRTRGFLSSVMPEPAPGTYTAGNLSKAVRERICRGADIPAQGTAPFDPSKACDALSGALGFAAIPAVTAPVADAAVPNTGCESVDAAAFRCP